MAITCEVTTAALNLRSAPNAASTVLAVLRQGQRCVASGPPGSGWLAVAYGEQAGYVWPAYVRRVDAGGGGPPAPSGPPAAPPAAVTAGSAPDIAPATGAGVPLPADPQTRLRAMDLLHPRFREALEALLRELAAEGRPFRVFEAFRTPERQRWLYEQGRTRPGGIVTKALPWQSFHQYGLAADLVLFVDGQWTWSDAGPLAAHWKRLPQMARAAGLRTLDWEAPHVEWPVDLGDAAGPDLMASADADWLDTVATAAARWRSAGHAGAPDVQLAERRAETPRVA